MKHPATGIQLVVYARMPRCRGIMSMMLYSSGKPKGVLMAIYKRRRTVVNNKSVMNRLPVMLLIP